MSNKFNRKKTIPGHQSQRGVGEKYPEAGPTQSYSISMTVPGHERLRELADSQSSPISTCIEDMAWGNYIVITREAWNNYVVGLTLEAQLQLTQALQGGIAQSSNADKLGDR